MTKNKNKKAGIITIVDLTNYGNRLQNYAVSEVLKKKGIASETLNFVECSPSTRVMCEIKQAFRAVPFIYDMTLFIMGKKSLKKKRIGCFNKFSRKYLPVKIFCVDEKDDLKRLQNKYDYFVIGSDQIWNPEYGHAKKQDFAFFAKEEQKICFSPSFGVSSIKKEYQKEIAKSLSGIPNISVRESTGIDIVKELSGKNAEVLIDPTMMLSADEWRKIKENPEVDMGKKYILSYFIGKRTKEHDIKIKEWKEKYGLEEYKLLDEQDIKLYCANPGEFISLIEHAEIVCTDSFHGSVFSILFGKPFVVFQRNGDGGRTSSRLDTLLGTFALTKRYVHNIEEADLFACDYAESYKILEKEREKVDKFLNKSFA